MKISIIIPVYNEVDTLNDCLRAIANLAEKPYEVIVVDNNSDDGSGVIAKSYDFVTYVQEKKQGVVHARTRGFNLARGELLARIDADTILPQDWTRTLAREFEGNNLTAMSGAAHYYNVALATCFNGVDLFFKRKLSRRLGQNMYLWAANMALRKDAWEKVRSSLCYRSGLHEDYDLAIHLQELGYEVGFSEKLVASVSSRRIETDFFGFVRYVWMSPSSYLQHNRKILRYFMPIVITCIVLYLPARLLYKGYDKDKKAFSWSKLIEPSQVIARVDPTTNVA